MVKSSDKFYILKKAMAEKNKKLVPIEDHIIVKPLEAEESKAGILIAWDKEKPTKWEVVAVGKGKILDNGQRAPMDVKVGDIVYFTKYSPDELEVWENWEKVKYLVIRHSSILAVETDA